MYSSTSTSTFAHEYNEYKYITSTRKNVLEYASTMYSGPNPGKKYVKNIFKENTANATVFELPQIYSTVRISK